jgi:hypothetical protein
VVVEVEFNGIRPLFGVKGVVHPKNRRKCKKEPKNSKKNLTEPTLLEITAKLVYQDLGPVIV